MDYSAIENHISLPHQSLSRATMERVLEATEKLLQEKAFEDLTILEISALSTATATSIYSRFGDKEGLLLAVHERFIHRAKERLSSTFDLGAVSTWSVDDIVSRFVSDLFRRYSANHFLLRSVLLSRHQTVLNRAHELLSFASRLQSQALLPRVADEANAEQCEATIDFMVQSVAALAQQWLIFAPFPPSRFENSEDELVQRATAAALLILHAEAIPASR